MPLSLALSVCHPSLAPCLPPLPRSLPPPSRLCLRRMLACMSLCLFACPLVYLYVDALLLFVCLYVWICLPMTNALSGYLPVRLSGCLSLSVSMPRSSLESWDVGCGSGSSGCFRLGNILRFPLPCLRLCMRLFVSEYLCMFLLVCLCSSVLAVHIPDSSIYLSASCSVCLPLSGSCHSET